MLDSRFFCLAVVLLAGAVHPARGLDDPKGKSTHPLIGKWRLDAIESDGRRRPQDSRTTVEFTDGGWTFESDDDMTTSGTYRVDDSKNPRWLDQRVERSSHYPVPDTPGRNTIAIYKIDGDTLTIASPTRSAGRPDGFVTRGKSVLLVVWTRIK